MIGKERNPFAVMVDVQFFQALKSGEHSGWQRCEVVGSQIPDSNEPQISTWRRVIRRQFQSMRATDLGTTESMATAPIQPAAVFTQ